MQTQVLKADINGNIEVAANLIRSGKLVAFPTETVYGLGADATSSAAVAKIFTVKKRPAFDPLIVHIGKVDVLNGVAEGIPDIAWRLIGTFWPGPLTLVLTKKDEIPDIVTAGLSTVAVRMPSNDIALALISKAGVPLAAPSANSFGRPSPTRAEHVMEDLGGKIPLILDGGTTKIGIESTVLDLTCSPPVILRPGGISQERLRRLLGKVSIFSTINDEALKSPGQMKQHYAPRAKVLLFEGKHQERVILTMKEKINELKPGNRVGVMVPEEELYQFADEDVVAFGLGSFNNMDVVASKLFEVMRALDKRGIDYVLCLAPPKEGIGLAVFDRLFKAAGSQLIEVV